MLLNTWTWQICIFLFGLLSMTSGAQEELQSNETSNSSRGGKVFSLFSVVQFKNTGCKSQSSMTSGQSTVRNGTCFTASECSNKGGSASGNCASGFGVCCLFLVSTSGSTINQNCTYIRNPGFPSAYTSTSALSYTIAKCSNDVCYLRLDFETFNTMGPTVSTEGTTVGYTCPDSFKVTTNTGQSIPTICGANTGQHMYIDLGTLSTDSATLAFTFSTTTSTTRAWEIKVSQITCSNPNRPPNGCLQYYTTLVGRITSFNWLTTSASSNLPAQSYSTCIRRAAGYCCVQYQVCASQTNAFSLDGSTPTMGLIDSKCTGDYVAIPGSSGTGCSSTNNAVSDKYCGSYLGFSNGAAANGNQVVCDCTDPFQIYTYTDSLGDFTANAAPATYSRGYCLDYMQVPCTSN